MLDRGRTPFGRYVTAIIALGLGVAVFAAPVLARSHRHRWAGHHAAIPASLTDPSKDAALVVDGATGKVLYARNANAERHPASLTKMMTLYLLFEALKKGQVTMNTNLPVSEHAAAQKPTKLHLQPGDMIPVSTAIEAIVVRSANDVAVTIAEALGGTESHFAEMMNAKARQIGMRNTFYHNASGLPDPLQISTAADLAVLAHHLAYDYPQYFHYFGIAGFSYRGITYPTHDNLIGRYQGADGIKTGYTGASGFNLVSSVVRGRNHIIAVVMGGVTAHRRDREMMNLLDKTFAQIQANPTMVASIKVPWQESTPTALASLDLSRISPQAAADPDDEDAAEALSDRDDNGNEIAPAQGNARVAMLPPQPQRTVVMQAPPPPDVRPAPPPPVAVNYPVPRPRPPLPKALLVAQNLPTPAPKPAAKNVIVAAYHPNQKVAMRSEAGEGDYSDDTTFSASKLKAQDWTIQIGAFANQSIARSELASYAERSMDVLGQASRIVVPFKAVDGQTLFRARFGPFVEREAREVCARLTERGQTCFAAL
ncbi:MAG TPA: D-alanyl-D-alanine carboxypeptidase, partial [Rhizomicrobium sp.]|nr:D-alanyl-D-alanine carboxypeptidase [Rhizomicrobium sp.]